MSEGRGGENPRPLRRARLIALDIDGTILDRPSGFDVPEAVRAAVADARRAGARVCLCSSRPAFLMEDATRAFEALDALIGCGGAVIRTQGELIFSDRLPETLWLAALETAKARDIPISFAAPEKILARRQATSARDNAAPDDTEPEDPVFETLDDGALIPALRASDISCAFLFARPGMTADDLFSAPSFAAAEICCSSETCHIVTSGGVNKGAALLRLADYWGIPQGAALAIGNDANDISMFKAAGVSAAVSNASPEALAAADWIVPSVREGGAADAIRRFVDMLI